MGNKCCCASDALVGMEPVHDMLFPMCVVKAAVGIWEPLESCRAFRVLHVRGGVHGVEPLAPMPEGLRFLADEWPS